MNAIQEEDLEMDNGGHNGRLRRDILRQSYDSDDMLQMKHNVQRALRGARRKIHDLRSEVDRK